MLPNSSHSYFLTFPKQSVALERHPFLYSTCEIWIPPTETDVTFPSESRVKSVLIPSLSVLDFSPASEYSNFSSVPSENLTHRTRPSSS